MNFAYYKLGHQQRGNVIEVTLSGSAANIRLLNSSHYQNYRAGRRHSYHGGLAKRSPATLTIPSSGTWHLVVDMQGLQGRVKSSIRIIPREVLSPLPEYREKPLSPLLRPLQQESNSGESIDYYDVFVSHATEDKKEVARPLANALKEAGLRVWYDEFELRIGDSLRRKIDFGLGRSRFGIVVLSPSFFAKKWPQYELDGLVTMEMTGEQTILPLWHRLTKDDVIRESPSLADKIARSTAEFTVQQIADEIADVIRVG